MAWPAIIGGAIAAGGALLGGQAQAESARAENQRSIDAAKVLNRENYENQKEFAQMGIRWRAADAEAAGFHPLTAIGGGSASFSPSSAIGGGATSGDLGLTQAGQDIGRAVAATQTTQERTYANAQLAAIQASTQKDLAQAQYWGSQAARGSAPGPAMPSNVTSVDMLPAHPLASNAVEPKADERLSSRSNKPSISAAPDKPFWSEYMFSGGDNRRPTRILLPQSDEGPGEALENVPWYLWPSVIGRNVEEYGAGWIRDFLPGSSKPLTEPAPSRPGAPTRLWKGRIQR